MINAYNTTYGSLINTTTITRELTKYVNTVELNELEFEYPSEGNTKTIFITGYSDDEREFPAWDHPMVITTLKGVNVVVSDIRRYVAKSDVIPARISDISKDKNSIDFIVLRALLTKDFLNKDTGKHRELFKSSTAAMGVWLSGMINTIVLLDPVEMFRVEIIASMYANTLYYDTADVEDNIETMIARVISSKHVYKFSAKEINTIASGYVMVRPEDSKLEELVINLQGVLPSEKHQFISIDSLIGVMGNVWYGPGAAETPIIALENMPVWLSILYSVITNRSYAKSRIGMLLNKHNKVIDAKAIDKYITNYLKEIRVV